MAVFRIKNSVASQVIDAEHAAVTRHFFLSVTAAALLSGGRGKGFG